MKKLLTALTLMALPVMASAWDLDDMNDHIEQTNFIIGNHCSGTLISTEHRLILTNSHCIQKYVSQVSEQVVGDNGVISTIKVQKLKDVPVSQKTYKGHKQVGSLSWMAEIVNFDEDVDLALIQLLSETIPHSREAKIHPGEDIQRGEVVFAIGNPRMLDASVTKGILSSVNRSIRLGNQMFSYYQMDARIAGGSSGGSLYNHYGELIGVPAAGSMDGSINLAIPLTSLKQFLVDSCFESVYEETATDDGVCETEEEETTTDE